MPSLDLVGIRQGLADQISDFTGLRVYPVVPDVPEFPCITIDPGSPYIDLNGTFTGTAGTLCTVNLAVSLYVSAASGWRDAQLQLDRLLSTGLTPDRCVYSAIESDRTIGGLAQTTVVQQVNGLGRELIQTDQGVQAYTAQLDVEIHTYR